MHRNADEVPSFDRALHAIDPKRHSPDNVRRGWRGFTPA
jgi:hypothetical protein